MGALTHKKNAFAMRVWESQSEYKLISKEVYFLVRVDKVKNRYARILPINLFMQMMFVRTHIIICLLMCTIL